MRERTIRARAALRIATVALGLSVGCADGATRTPGPGAAGSGGGGSSGGPAGGSSGVGGAAGIGSPGGSSPDGSGQAVGSVDASVGSVDAGVGSVDASVGSVDAPLTDASVARDAGADSSASRCSPACGGTTPLCDERSATCRPIEVLALYTAYEQNLDLAHRSWVREANAWFPTVAQANGFTYQAIVGWDTLATVTPAIGRVVLFLDNRPVDPGQQASFQSYMEGGGAWIGFHVAAYNAMPSVWDWYFNQLLGSGGYNGNTWRPTSANLRVEDTAHPVAQGLGSLFASAPNEWYAWKEDLRTKPNIKILCSIDPSSFPLGTGPVPTEIWYSGYYPVVWTNTNYRMLYVNMGHNDMDYEGGTNRQLSFAFRNPVQNQMLLNAIKWLGGAVKGP